MNLKNPYKLIQTIVDSQETYMLILEEDKPLLMNKAMCTFFGVSSFEEYSQNFGAFVNNFVPHPSYFHKEKVSAGSSWLEALEALNEKDKIVSMINTVQEPRAFRVSIDSSHENYTVMSLKDISADLIKCIMIENNVSIDKKSGAYNKEYFMHTAELLQDGARFNEKRIGITFFELLDECDLQEVVRLLKGVSRQNDMLVKYSRNKLLMAYLVDTKEHALIFSKKLQETLNPQVENKMIVSLLKADEKIQRAVSDLNSQIEEVNSRELKVL